MANEGETRKQDAVEDLHVDGKEVDEVRGGAEPTPAEVASNLAKTGRDLRPWTTTHGSISSR
jgi:hypothetical protein